MLAGRLPRDFPEKSGTEGFVLQFPLESGDDLLSRAVSSQVPSALRGLTSVFGMGTGGSLLPLSPEIFIRLWISFHTLKTAQ